MKHNWRALALVILLAGLGTGGIWQIWQIGAGIRGVQEQLETLKPRGRDMQVATASWQSGGILIEVETVRIPGESDADFAQRHRDAVDAMKVKFPVD